MPTAQIEQEDLQAGEPTDETVEEEQAEEAEAAKEEAKDEDADINENEKVDPAKAKPWSSIIIFQKPPDNNIKMSTEEKPCE